MLDRSIEPEIKPFPKVTFQLPTSEKLSNGAEVSVINYGEVEVVQVDIYVGCGHFEQPSYFLATILMRLLAKGSDKLTAEEVAEQIDYYGVRLTTSVHDHHIKISFRCVNKNLDKVLPILMDCIKNPRFPEKEFENICEKLLADMAINMEQVSYLASAKMSQIYYGKEHPLASYGKDDEVAINVTIDDLREFHSRYFAPGNCKVVVSGKVDDDALQVVKENILDWQERPFDAMVPWWKAPQNERFTVVDKPDAIQTAVEITIDAVPREHPDYIKLRILATVLGGYFGSRLMMNIREDKGYTYGISAYLAGRKDDGLLGISTECGVQYTADVLKQITFEMSRLREELIPEEELDMVRSHMISDLMKTFDSAFAIASYVDMTITVGLYPEYFNAQFEQINSVTAEELRELAKKYLREDKMTVVLAGDAKNLPESM